MADERLGIRVWSPTHWILKMDEKNVFSTFPDEEAGRE